MDDFVQRWSNPRIKYFKSGIRIPLTDHEDLRSFTESTNSTSLIHGTASVGNCEQVHTSVKMRIWNLSRCWSTPHNTLKNLPHKEWLNFWLTVLTGISDLELVFDSHSSPPVMSELVPTYENSKDSIPVDKVLKKTLLDLQKRFPMYHVSQMLGGPSLRLGIPIERLSIPSGIGWGGKDTSWLVTWECPLRTDSASWKSLESFIQLISFCNSCVLPVSSRIVSWSSSNLLLAIVSNVDPWNRFNSSFSLRLCSWASPRSQFCFNNCSWRSCWSRRWSSSARAQWSSSCCDSIVSLNYCILLRS